MTQKKDVFLPRLYGLLHLSVFGVSPSRLALSYPIDPILFYPIPQMVIFVAAFTLRRFESQMKLNAEGDGLSSSFFH